MSQQDLQRTLLALLSRRYRPGPFEPVSLPEADWPRLVQLADRQALAPLLYHILQGSPERQAVPSGAMQALRDRHRANALRNMSIYGELHRVLAALHDAGVPVIVLKGAYLAQAVYGDLALRTMGDVDILVKKDHFDWAERVLSDLGYHFVEGRGVRDHWLSDHYHLRFASPDERLLLEVHWHLQRRYDNICIDINECWNCARPVNIAGSPSWTLSPKHLLAQICLHVSYQHVFGFFAMRSLCDIAEILRCFQEKIFWTEVLEIFHRWEVGRSVYLTLRLANELLNDAIPETVLEGIRPKDFEIRYLTWAKEQITSVSEEELNAQPDPIMAERFWKVWTSSNLPVKLIALMQAFFPPYNEIAPQYQLPLVSREALFYYSKRVVDLFTKYGYRAWLFLLHDRQTLRWIDREKKRGLIYDWLTLPSDIGSSQVGSDIKDSRFPLPSQKPT